ncbi:MAG: hypothetical protein GYA55_04670 [SAR324 cluster bacterium]|uniref:Uncharacterized protein n=1 Tax=SAR324 cluster bacterium TaxID=2024889 RepID=A0A7X9IJT2_9DELT|nr:hypothetical protein [SAR324 cluster bacterium]
MNIRTMLYIFLVFAPVTVVNAGPAISPSPLFTITPAPTETAICESCIEDELDDYTEDIAITIPTPSQSVTPSSYEPLSMVAPQCQMQPYEAPSAVAGNTCASQPAATPSGGCEQQDISVKCNKSSGFMDACVQQSTSGRPCTIRVNPDDCSTMGITTQLLHKTKNEIYQWINSQKMKNTEQLKMCSILHEVTHCQNLCQNPSILLCQTEQNADDAKEACLWGYYNKRCGIMQDQICNIIMSLIIDTDFHKDFNKCVCDIQKVGGSKKTCINTCREKCIDSGATDEFCHSLERCCNMIGK